MFHVNLRGVGDDGIIRGVNAVYVHSPYIECLGREIIPGVGAPLDSHGIKYLHVFTLHRTIQHNHQP